MLKKLCASLRRRNALPLTPSHAMKPPAVGYSYEESYYAVASEWQDELYENQRVWLARSILLNAVLLLLLTLSFVLFIFLFPLKENVPFLYSVNTSTGELTQIGKLSPAKLEGEWSLTRFLVMRYVMNREAFDSDNLEQPYQIAWAMSEAAVARRYEEEASSQNAQSPYNQYGKTRYVTVRILSVARLNETTASVRFEQRIHERTSEQQHVVTKEAIVKWRYTNAVTTQKMLDRDPLGFKVTYYQTSTVNTEKPA